MKRYDIEAYCRVCDCEITTKKRPSEDGDYYLVTDVERTMIPRPDAEAARKAVDELVNAATCFEAAHSNPLFGDYKEESIADLQRTKAAVIEMMGVENA